MAEAAANRPAPAGGAPAERARTGGQGGGSGKGFGVFRNRNFRLLWTGAVASNVGTWMQNVAQGLLVVHLTHSPGWVGAVALSSSIPFLVLPLFGGVIADRVDRVKLLTVTQAFAMMLAFVLAALTISGLVQVWMVLVLAFLNSMSSSFDQPTRNALLPDLVKDDELMQAVSLNSTAFQGAALIGPAIAGVLVGVIGYGGCFLINGFSYLFVILALFMMKVPKTTRTTVQKAVGRDLIEGLSFLKRAPTLMCVLLLTCCFSIFGRSYTTLIPAFAKLVLNTNSEAVGFMYMMPGLGTIVGGFALTVYGDVRLKGTFAALTAVATGVFLFFFATSSALPILLVLLIGLGIVNVAFNATVSTILQINSPPNMRGRVMSYNTIAWRGLTPLGGGLVGGLAEIFGTREAMAGGAIAVVVAALALYLLTPFLHAADSPREVAEVVLS